MNKYIIDFVDTTEQNEIQNFLDTNSLSVQKIFDSLGKIYLVSGESIPPDHDIVESVQSDSVLSINFEEVVSVPVNDDNWWKIASYADDDVNPDTTSLDIEIKDPIYDVYVVDSGINHDHTEFSGQNIINLFSATSGDFSDVNGHGTAMTSLITGNTCAITRANIANVKIIDQNGAVTLSSLLEALDVILTDSSNKPTVPAMANLSWTIPYNEYVNAKVQHLINSGITVVTSAGNQGVELNNFTPACIADAFTVGAYNQMFEPADFSNYSGSTNDVNSGTIDLWAPGTNILVANHTGGYKTIQGTSPSTAIVCACICYCVSEVENIYTNNIGIPFNKQTAGQSTIAHMNNQRSGILDFGDFNYGVNKIATFTRYGNGNFKQYWLTKRKGDVSTEIFMNPEGFDLVFKFIYWPEDVATATLIPDQSNKLNLALDQGWLVGQLPELTNENPGNIYNFEIHCESHDGTTTIIEITYFHRTYDEDVLANLDEIAMDDQLRFMFDNEGPCSGFTTPVSFFCFNDCNPVEYCDENKTVCFCSQ